jgi:hypothetical protein
MTIAEAGGSRAGNIIGVEIVPTAEKASGLWNIIDQRESRRFGNWPYYLYGIQIWSEITSGAFTSILSLSFHNEVSSGLFGSVSAVRGAGAFSTYRDGYFNSAGQTGGIGGTNSQVAKWTYPINLLFAVTNPGQFRRETTAISSTTDGYIMGGSAGSVPYPFFDTEKYDLATEAFTILPTIGRQDKGAAFDAGSQAYIVFGTQGNATSPFTSPTNTILTLDYSTDAIAVSANTMIEPTNTATGFQTSTYARVLTFGTTSSTLRFDELEFSTGVVSAGTPPTTVAVISRGAFTSPTGGYHYIRTFPTVSESFNRYTFASDTWVLLSISVSGTAQPSGVAPPVWR